MYTTCNCNSNLKQEAKSKCWKYKSDWNCNCYWITSCMDQYMASIWYETSCAHHHPSSYINLWFILTLQLSFLFIMQGYCWPWTVWSYDESLLQICVSFGVCVRMCVCVCVCVCVCGIMHTCAKFILLQVLPVQILGPGTNLYLWTFHENLWCTIEHVCNMVSFLCSWSKWLVIMIMYLGGGGGESSGKNRVCLDSVFNLWYF